MTWQNVILGVAIAFMLYCIISTTRSAKSWRREAKMNRDSSILAEIPVQAYVVTKDSRWFPSDRWPQPGHHEESLHDQKQLDLCLELARDRADRRRYEADLWALVAASLMGWLLPRTFLGIGRLITGSVDTSSALTPITYNVEILGPLTLPLVAFIVSSKLGNSAKAYQKLAEHYYGHTMRTSDPLAVQAPTQAPRGLLGRLRWPSNIRPRRT